MSDPPTVTYRAFLSYSHRDKAQAVAWHQRLETLSIPDDLHGANTPLGPVPPHLRPIFRDELDFEPGRELTQATRDALDASAALILIASPNARISDYVNEEVRHFRATWPNRPIIPILCGPRGTAFRDHLPPALAYELDGDGQPTTAEHTPLASNPRSGTEATRIRVAARTLGLTGPRLTVWVRDAVQTAREKRESNRVARQRDQQTHQKLDDLTDKVRQLLVQTAGQGIAKSSGRPISSALSTTHEECDRVIGWFRSTFEEVHARISLLSEDTPIFDAAWQVAEQEVSAGRQTQASDILMVELAREQAQEASRLELRHRHRVAMLEAAIILDIRTPNFDAIPRKLRMLATELGIVSTTGIRNWLSERGDVCYAYGRDKGDNAALFVALAIYRDIAADPGQNPE